jgi:tripartite-type tricarboxylate transporter receptor subunit TctC
MQRRTFIALPCLAAAGIAFAQAKAYPDKPIKLIVPTGAAGITDVLARVIGVGLEKALETPVVIDNRPGAGGAIGGRALAAAPKDGYTLLFGNTATLATIPATSKKAGYDPAKDFAAVAQAFDSYQVVVVRPDLPVHTVAELIAYARAHPGKLNFGAAGVGNITHLSGELLKARTGITFETAQYKSGTEALTAMLGGQVDFAIDNVSGVKAMVDAGKLRAIAVTSSSRSAELPDLPTMAEAGVKDYVVTAFFGIVAPAGTSPQIIERLNAAINEVVQAPATQQRLGQLGVRPAVGSPERFGTFIASEVRKWSDIARTAHIDIDQ